MEVPDALKAMCGLALFLGAAGVLALGLLALLGINSAFALWTALGDLL